MARSTAEAEYRAVTTTIAELLWIFYVLQDFDIGCSGSIVLMCDNKSTLQMLKNPTHHEKTKYIDIDFHFVRHHVTSGFLNHVFVPTSLQLANIFTKPLGPSVFSEFHDQT